MRFRVGLVPITALTLAIATGVPAGASHTQLTWYQSDTNTSGGVVDSFAYGSFGDQPLPGDWDNDGDATVGVVRPLDNGHWRWILKDANVAGVTTYDFEFGNWMLGDVPVQGDWNDAGPNGVGVVRPLDNGHLRWILDSSVPAGEVDFDFEYGNWLLGDQPVTGDWEGNPNGSEVPGDSVGVVRPLSNGHWRWLLRDAASAGAATDDFEYGNWELGDFPIPGDWDGRGPGDDADVTTVGVARPLSNGHLSWLLKNDNAAGAPSVDPAAFEFGNWELGDFPVAGDWDGSGTTEGSNTGATAGVVRPPA